MCGSHVPIWTSGNISGHQWAPASSQVKQTETCADVTPAVSWLCALGQDCAERWTVTLVSRENLWSRFPSRTSLYLAAFIHLSILNSLWCCAPGATQSSRHGFVLSVWSIPPHKCMVEFLFCAVNCGTLYKRVCALNLPDWSPHKF